MLSNLAPWPENTGSGDVLAGIIGALVATNYIEILKDPDNLGGTKNTEEGSDLYYCIEDTIREHFKTKRKPRRALSQIKVKVKRTFQLIPKLVGLALCLVEYS